MLWHVCAYLKHFIFKLDLIICFTTIHLRISYVTYIWAFIFHQRFCKCRHNWPIRWFYILSASFLHKIQSVICSAHCIVQHNAYLQLQQIVLKQNMYLNLLFASKEGARRSPRQHFMQVLHSPDRTECKSKKKQYKIFAYFELVHSWRGYTSNEMHVQ